MNTVHLLTTRKLISSMLISIFAGAVTVLVMQKAISLITTAQASATEASDSYGAREGSSSLQKESKKAGHPVVHFDIGCRDIAKTTDFYSKVFDWQIQQAGQAAFINTGSSEGIQGHITSLGHEPNNYVTIYVEVEDLKAYLDKAATLGGKTVVPPVRIPTGRFAWIADPEGNLVGLLEPKPAASK